MVQRYNPDYVMHAARFAPFARENEHGEFVKFSDYEVLKAERDALADRADALAVENQALNELLDSICNAYNEELTDLLDIAVKMAVKLQTPATDAALAAIQAQGVEKAQAVVSACRENICPGGLSENRQYEESIVQPHLDGIADELENLIIELREAK
ncbi:hypothetical protein [Serratia marcescens]|uniref:hypothetical protein n=1 Tax=Serratia marcescens TaxID=615 RepID=UPI001376D619|nr:hypothetical protein [Serratia marcescens]MBH3207552.1 hypothetical protein [Serratia marcescens]NCI54417.1 hypothetical protein [Serratia marcescens]NDJ05682.1 hypothetical protein [Serratia marcescens]NDJ29964.1 hypothetical protein [Serratia marcescens]NDJ42841.1 hypothetical protein [Serratia marcescens]